MSGEDRDYRALFEHVGVTDLTDWQAVALRLAERYAPETLKLTAASTRRGRGRPPKWDIFSRHYAREAVETALEASRNRTLGRDLRSKKSACAFIVERSPEAAEWRDRYGIPHDATLDALYNRVCG